MCYHNKPISRYTARFILCVYDKPQSAASGQVLCHVFLITSLISCYTTRLYFVLITTAISCESHVYMDCNIQVSFVELSNVRGAGDVHIDSIPSDRKCIYIYIYIYIYNGIDFTRICLKYGPFWGI